MTNSKNIAIVYYSAHGHTEVLADHIIAGSLSIPGINAKKYNVVDIHDNLNILDKMDAIVFGTPTYMGSAAAEFKKFMDLSSKLRTHKKWNNKLAAGFSSSGSLCGERLNTVIQLVIFAMQHGMIWIGQDVTLDTNIFETGHNKALNRMGSTLGLSAQSENASSAITPPKGDRDSAYMFGQRIAKLSLAFKLVN